MHAYTWWKWLFYLHLCILTQQYLQLIHVEDFMHGYQFDWIRETPVSSLHMAICYINLSFILFMFQRLKTVQPLKICPLVQLLYCFKNSERSFMKTFFLTTLNLFNTNRHFQFVKHFLLLTEIFFFQSFFMYFNLFINI